MVGCLIFKVNEEVILKATSLAMEVRKWKMMSKASDYNALNQFFNPLEEPVKKKGRFRREDLLGVCKDIFHIIIKYFTREGKFIVYYFYHFPFLNHLRHIALISIMFYLLHSIEYNIEANKNDKNNVILHQGLLFRLYKFHLTLCLLIREPIVSHAKPPSPLMPTLPTLARKDPK